MLVLLQSSVMEDQEVRRARLKAMREQAEAHPSQSTPAPAIPTTRLTNPFEDQFPTSDAQTPRFNYYSDPLAGFTNPKRKERGSVGQQHTSSTSPYPLQNLTIGSSTWQPEFHPPGGPPPPFSHLSGGFGSPIPSFDPYQPGFPLPPPPAPGPQQRMSEGSWNTDKQHHGPGRGRGRGYAGNNSWSDSGPRGGGRGGGSWRGDMNRSGGRGGRGPKLQRTGDGPGASARERPDIFFDKSMVEDPWRHLY